MAYGIKKDKQKLQYQTVQLGTISASLISVISINFHIIRVHSFSPYIAVLYFSPNTARFYLLSIDPMCSWLSPITVHGE